MRHDLEKNSFQTSVEVRLSDCEYLLSMGCELGTNIFINNVIIKKYEWSA